MDRRTADGRIDRRKDRQTGRTRRTDRQTEMVQQYRTLHADVRYDSTVTFMHSRRRAGMI